MKKLVLSLCAILLAVFSSLAFCAETAPKPTDALPLQTTRTVSFDTDEGTWLSLDVSPDGSTIVFDLLGDIYTLPIAGGTAKPILTGNAFDSQPRFSPDGKSIVFISDRDGADNVCTAAADGTDLRQLSHLKHGDLVSPNWTPDGRYIMVAQDSDVFGGRELWLYDVHGGSGMAITKASPEPDTPSAQQLNISGPVASSDGKYIYYAERHGLFGYDAKFPIWQIVRRDRSTGDADVITNEEGSAIRPLISPDNNLLVYGTRIDAKTGLRVRNLRTGQEHWLKFPVDRDEQEGIGTRDMLPGYAFMPDGKSIVVNYGGHIHRVSVDGKTDNVIPFTAHVEQYLGPLLNFPGHVKQGPVVSRLAQDPKLSPDGDSIVYSAFAHLYIAHKPWKTPQRLSQDNTPAFEPAWSPDGKWISYVTWDRTGGALWKVAADGGSAPQRLTATPEYYSVPVWSPDGKTIIALRSSVRARDHHAVEYTLGQQDPSVPETYIVSVDVSPAIGTPSDNGVHVIDPARDRFDPQFTADPSRIYFRTGRGLVSVRADGSDSRDLLRVVGFDTQGRKKPVPAAQLSVNPAGNAVLALVNHQVYLLDLPLVGGKALEVDVHKPSEAVKRLSIDGADSIGWSSDGKDVIWSLGATFFRMSLADVPWEISRADGTKEEKLKGDRPAFKPEEINLAVEEPRSIPHGDLLLRGARIITMKGDEVIENGDLLIHDNHIAAVGKHGSLEVPHGATVMDLRGATIMPGIIDVHAHWTQIRRGVLDLDSWPLLANLAYGVTAGRDPQTFTNDIFAYQDLIDTGQMLGPRTYSTGPGVFKETDFHSLQDAIDTLTRYKTYYGTKLIKSYEVGNRQQRQWMVMASEKLHMMPTTEGGIDTRLDLTHMLDGMSGNEHNLPQVPLYKDIVTLFAKSGTIYTPTLIVNYGGQFALNYFLTNTEVHDDPKLEHFIPHYVLDSITNRGPWVRKQEYIFPQVAAQAAKILRAGGVVGLGGHGMMQGLQCHWEMWAMSAGGMTNLEVIRVATIDGAKAMGLADDLGSIEKGKLADLIVLNKNPLDDIHNTNTIRFVMKNGELFKGENLDQVWPVKTTMLEFWWEQEVEDLKSTSAEKKNSTGW
ncbi:MAG TPA: amidohydrolase family protein [Terracidiphilus sp.]|nr:amidohydrolase family protein [Terracidiphilus sp.]